MAFVKFDATTDAAAKLKAEILKKLQEVWDPQLEDDAIAQYTLALISRGPDRKKVHAQLLAVLGEDTTTELLDWCGIASGRGVGGGGGVQSARSGDPVCSGGHAGSGDCPGAVESGSGGRRDGHLGGAAFPTHPGSPTPARPPGLPPPAHRSALGPLAGW
jgi:hypothetical protein